MKSILAGGTVMIVAIMAIGYWMPHSIAEFKKFSTRTEQPEYKVEFETYGQMVDVLTKLSLSQNKKLKVAFDPILFPPTSNSKYTLLDFWGPYVTWDSDVDVIVFSTVHTLRGAHCLAGSPNYQACLIERDMYAKYVIDKGKTCAQAKCYERYVELPNEGELLVLKRGH